MATIRIDGFDHASLSELEMYHRIDDHVSCSVDEFDVVHSHGPHLRHSVYKVAKRTPKGVWLDLGFGLDHRFVRDKGRKRFALPTLEEAVASFIARKKRQIKIHTAALTRAKAALQKAQEFKP